MHLVDNADELQANSARMKDNVIPFDPALITRALAVAALVILLLSVAGQVAATYLDGSFVRAVASFLHVDEEKNVPTAFAVLLLLFATCLLATIAAVEHRSGGRWAWHWSLLAAGFALMAIDEAWSFHERLIAPGRRLLGGGELGIFFYAWVLFAIGLLALLVPVFLRFVLDLPRATRNRFILAGALFVGGAIGTELIAGAFNEARGLHEDRYGYGLRHLQYSLLATVEEGLEFAGSLVFIHALMLHIGGAWAEIRFRFARSSPA